MTAERSGKSTAMETLFAWAAQHGARFSQFSLQNDGLDGTASTRKITTLQPIASGAELCFIPSELLVSEVVAAASDVGKCITDFINEKGFSEAQVTEKEDEPWTWYPHAKEMICLVAFMVTRTPDSHWYPYLASLPREYDLPVFWDKELEHGLLQGTPLEFMTIRRFEWLDSVLSLLQQCCSSLVDNVTRQDLVWVSKVTLIAGILWDYFARVPKIQQICFGNR
jgi:hypothetical protein